MTHSEIDLLASVTSAMLGGGRAEFQLLNTDETWTLVESALAANAFKTVEEYRADTEDIEYVERPDGPVIHTQGYLLRGYLMEKALHELREAAR